MSPRETLAECADFLLGQPSPEDLAFWLSRKVREGGIPCVRRLDAYLRDQGIRKVQGKVTVEGLMERHRCSYETVYRAMRNHKNADIL